jgi:DNA-damage-inducible protein D
VLEAKLKRDHVNTQERAIQANHEVGREVRNAVKRMGGTMPEHLPTEPNLKKVLTPKQRRRVRELAEDERKTRLLGQGSK